MDEYVKKKNIINQLMEEKKDKSLFYDHNCSLKEALAYEDGLCNLAKMVFDMDAEEVVPKAAYDQVRWERDVCLEQLHSIGKELGEKMDDVARKKGHLVFHVDNDFDIETAECSVCHAEGMLYGNFCPTCGADLRGAENDKT